MSTTIWHNVSAPGLSDTEIYLWYTVVGLMKLNSGRGQSATLLRENHKYRNLDKIKRSTGEKTLSTNQKTRWEILCLLTSLTHSKLYLHIPRKRKEENVNYNQNNFVFTVDENEFRKSLNGYSLFLNPLTTLLHLGGRLYFILLVVGYHINPR